MMKESHSVLRENLYPSSDAFLSLFPHRFDYIWAEYPDSGQRVNWQTESRHPLSDRLIQQGSYLYGVRFGAETRYCLLDIDAASPYHPKQDPFAIARIVACLEPLGLVSYVACTSSYSGGLHLYFPFEEAQSSWKLAIVVTTLIENAGFKVRPGQLEIFPDPKPYRIEGKSSLFNAHRLPLQIGSYLLNAEFQSVWSTQAEFVEQWQLTQARNTITALEVRQVLKQVQRRRYAVSTKAEKFINDLNAEIELGWTGFGQTNYLLGRITMREYIFRHILTGGRPLVGSELVTAVVNVARSLPGYWEYCRHQHEIEKRAEEWVHCIENSHYFHYGDAAGRFKAKAEEQQLENQELKTAITQTPTWNQQQSASARDRIRNAISDLLNKNALPALATPRYRALLDYGIGGQTLYNHRDLWHPACLEEDPLNPSNLNQDSGTECHEVASASTDPASLFSSDGSDTLPCLASSDLSASVEVTSASDSSIVSPELLADVAKPQAGHSEVHSGVQYIRQVLSGIQQQRSGQKTTAQQAQQQSQQMHWEAAIARQKAKMQNYLASGDPILIAEALAWLQSNDPVEFRNYAAD